MGNKNYINSNGLLPYISWLHHRLLPDYILGVTLISLGLLTLTACNSDNNQMLKEARPISISILHDNDSALTEWLASALEPFKTEIAPSYPANHIELSLLEESTSRAIDGLATGRLKVDAVLLPHYGFSEIINGKLINLGAIISSCQDLIGSPYVAVIPATQSARLSGLLARTATAVNAQSIPVSLQELGTLLSSSWYGYTHPRRSTRGQFGLLLSIAAVAPEYFDGQATWVSTTERVKEIQKHLEWYAPSDTQLLKRIASQNTVPQNGANNEIYLGLISLRQLLSRSEYKDALVTLTPSNGTIWERHSLCISTADWVSPVKKSILLKLQNFLTSPLMLTKAKELGFLPVDKDSEISPKSIALLKAQNELSTETINALQKPFALAFAIDTSASMSTDTLNHIRNFSLDLFSSSPPSSSIDYINFSSDVELLGNRDSSQGILEKRLLEITPSGGSSIYDAIAMQYEILSQTQPSSHRRIALIITDGNDKNSARSLEELITLIKNREKTKGFISLRMVVLSPAKADLEPLKKIIEAANGILFETEPEGLPDLLAEIRESL